MTAEATRLPRILCMDDHKEACDELVSVLSKLPARVDAAYDGDTVIDRLLESGTLSDPYDLLVLDMCVPVALGEQVNRNLGLTVLFTSPYYRLLRPGTPIIIYTQYATYRNCVECISAGATDYIDKAGDPHTGETGMRILFGRCKALLHPERNPHPLREWLEAHRIDLIRAHGGSYVALVEQSVARNARIAGSEMEGYVLLSGRTPQELRDQILQNRALRWSKPQIINVPRAEVSLL